MDWLEVTSKVGPYAGAAVSLAVAVDARRRVSRLQRETDRGRVLLQVQDFRVDEATGRDARLLFVAFEATSWVTHEARLTALSPGVALVPAKRNISRDSLNEELVTWSWDPSAGRKRSQSAKMSPNREGDWKHAWFWAFSRKAQVARFRVDITDLGTGRRVLRHALVARDDA